jgi:type IV secretory pathway ATPase VirB11/archaellum biosynthesis ATPase
MGEDKIVLKPKKKRETSLTPGEPKKKEIVNLDEDTEKTFEKAPSEKVEELDRIKPPVPTIEEEIVTPVEDTKKVFKGAPKEAAEKREEVIPPPPLIEEEIVTPDKDTKETIEEAPKEAAEKIEEVIPPPPLIEKEIVSSDKDLIETIEEAPKEVAEKIEEPIPPPLIEEKIVIPAENTEEAFKKAPKEAEKKEEPEPPAPTVEAEPEVKKVSKTRRRKIKTISEMLELYRTIQLPAVKRGISRIFKKNHKIRPGFSFTWVTPYPPDDAKLIFEDEVDGSKIGLYVIPGKTESLYHIFPSEYSIPIEHMKLIYLTKQQLIEHYPKTVKLDRPEQAREYVLSIGNRLIYQLAKRHDINLGKTREKEMQNVKNLSEILAKYTAGYGISEFFLKHKIVQDIYIDSPASENLVYITIGGIADPRLHHKCITNISLGDEDTESMLSRFRYESGRPFSEAMPVLETDLSNFATRVTAIGKPLSPDGIAIALRRHSIDPWTLLKFIANGMISPMAAGLISFLIDGRATMLVAGSRGSGKSSLLGAIMLEFPQSQRIIAIEDTLELPVPNMQTLGYKIQSLFVQSTLGGKGEMTADDALRVSLRLGESAIVMGEVRGQEAKTLYEAMRAGSAGSSVLGTFHADSAKAVFRRVVSDMKIPAKSFNATDMVIIAGLTRPAGSHKVKRRVIQIAEVLKKEDQDGAFQDLMAYDEKKDALVPTDAFYYRSEKIGSIAGSWDLTLEEAVKNIQTRAAYRQKIVKYSKDNKKPQLLSAEWVMMSNNMFWELMEKHTTGKKIDYDAVMKDWTEWFTRGAEYA